MQKAESLILLIVDLQTSLLKSVSYSFCPYHDCASNSKFGLCKKKLRLIRRLQNFMNPYLYQKSASEVAILQQ